MSKNIIQIRSSDELASIIDSIVNSSEENVYLVVPENSYVAQNVLNFRLIKREADSVNKRVTIVTEDERIQTLAGKAALRVTEKIDKEKPKPAPGPASDLKKVQDIIPPKPEQEKTPAPHKTKKTEKPEKSVGAPPKQQPNQPKEKHKTSKKSPKRIRISFSWLSALFSGLARAVHIPGGLFKKSPKKSAFALAGIVILFGLYFVATNILPKATVILNPGTAKEDFTLNFVADANITSSDYETGVIPAQITRKEQEKTFTFQATGTENVEERAEGTIEVYNEYNSAPQTLVQNTRFISSGGKLFRTTETVQVPGARVENGDIVPSSITVQVRAAEPGEEYNIDPTTFSIPGFKGTDKYYGFYGESKEPMEGGLIGQRSVITDQDESDAREKVNEDFLPEVEAALKEEMPEDLKVIPDSMDVSIENFEIDAGEGEVFDVNVTALARAFLIQPDHINEAISYRFNNESEYAEEFELSDKNRIDYTVKELDFQEGVAEVETDISQIYNKKVGVDALVDKIKGRGEVEVRKILSSRDDLEKAQVRFWPFWVKNIPSSEEDIEVRVEYNAEL